MVKKSTKSNKSTKSIVNPLVRLKSPGGHVPEWFEEIENHIGTHRRDAGIDHVRGYKNVAILQPYHAEGEPLLALLNACKERGLKVFLSGKTNYYPSWSFTICVYKPEDEVQMREYVHAHVTTNIEVPTEGD